LLFTFLTVADPKSLKTSKSTTLRPCLFGVLFLIPSQRGKNLKN
jgi:hypothetical protein